jgi:hypothetical protein
MNPIGMEYRKAMRETVYEFEGWAQSWSKFDLFCLCFGGGAFIWIAVQLVTFFLKVTL